MDLIIEATRSPKFHTESSTLRVYTPLRRASPPPSDMPPVLLEIFEEDLNKYFSKLARVSFMISLLINEDMDIVDATLQKEIPTKLEEVALLRGLLFRVA